MFIKRVQEFGKPRMEDLVWDLFCTEHDKYTVGLGIHFFLSRNYLMMEEKITNSLHELLNFSCKKNKSKTLVMAGPICTFRLITFKGRLMFLIHVFLLQDWPGSCFSGRNTSVNCTMLWCCQGPHTAERKAQSESDM